MMTKDRCGISGVCRKTKTSIVIVLNFFSTIAAVVPRGLASRQPPKSDGRSAIASPFHNMR
jgi:hypothetical protein